MVTPRRSEFRACSAVCAAGRSSTPTTARSQLIGGMTWGLSMALFEESLMDAEFGDYLNHDLAGYHFAGERGRGPTSTLRG